MLLKRAWMALLALISLAAAPAYAQQWTGPDTRRPALIGHHAENFDIAIANICFAYLFQGAEPASWLEPNRTGIIRRSQTNGLFEGTQAFFVSRHVSAGVREDASGRECIVLVERGEPEEARAVLLVRLGQMPSAMTLAGYQYPPGNFTRRELYCAARGGPNDAALVSTGPRTDGGHQALVVTFRRDQTRSQRCDGIPPSAPWLTTTSPSGLRGSP